MDIELFKDPAYVINLITKIVAIAAIVTATQSLSHFRSLYTSDGLLQWRTLRKFHRFSHIHIINLILDRFLDTRGIFLILAIRLIASVILLFFHLSHLWSSIMIFIIFFSLALTVYREIKFLDAGYSFLLMLCAALWVQSWSPTSHMVQKAFLFFLSFQLVLAYTTLGFRKLSQQEWRSGHVGVTIFRDPSWVFRRFLHLGWNSPDFVARSEQLLIIWQMSFPFILILESPYYLIYILVGVLFHFINALFMGLNVFLFSWLAAYPALIYTHNWLQQHVLTL